MPRNNKNSIKKSSDITIDSSGYWIYITSELEPNYSISGKYLFFYKEKEKLIEIAKNEIQNHSFHIAKVNSRLLGDTEEYVLCLYYKNDSRKYELAERSKLEYPEVKYRYWKSDIDTIRGKYSNEFLSKLSEADKKRFTKKLNS